MLRSPRRAAPLGTLTIALAFALAACGGASASVAPATPPPSGTVLVEAKEYQFTPSTISVPAGTVTFSVRNGGNEEHEFEIFKGETVLDEIEGLVPGLSKSLSVTLEAGEYTYLCALNGHDQLGMQGTLTVN